MFGTFLFDSLIFREEDPSLVEKVIKTIDKPDKERKKIFDQVNSNYFERIKYTLPSDI